MNKLLFITSALILWFSVVTVQSGEPDPDYRINVVREYLGLSEGPANAEMRANWLLVYKYMTQPRTVGVMGVGFYGPPTFSKPEGHLGTRVTRLQNPKDPEQKRVANILIAQPVPKERTEHYAAVLKQCFFEGWAVHITSAATDGGVTTVTAMWLPAVRSRTNGRASINNPLVETWEVKGEEARLLKTTSQGDAYISTL